jgi:hypothetical protein
MHPILRTGSLSHLATAFVAFAAFGAEFHDLTMPNSLDILNMASLL